MAIQLSFLEPKQVSSTPVRKADPAGGTRQDDEYNTPKWLWQLGQDVFGLDEYDIDPATNETSAVPDSKKFMLLNDGLSRSWKSPKREMTRGWLNPPFSKNSEFVEKLCSEYQKGGLEMIVLDKHDHRVGWWWELEAAAAGLCLIRGYVQFEGHSQSYRFPVSIFYFGPNYEAFERVFKDYGRCVQL